MPKNAVSAKIAKMVSEGYKPKVASAAAYSMKRRGDLGPKGGYQKKTDRPSGPRGKQRA